MAALYLFTEDLRLSSNKALRECCANDDVIFLYVNDEKALGRIGQSQRWWLSKSISALGESLKKKSAKLVTRNGSTADIIKQINKKVKLSSIYLNRCVSPERRKVESKIKSLCKSENIEYNAYKFDWLVDHEELVSSSGGYMKVFTPFYRKAYKEMLQQEPFQAPRTIRSCTANIKSEKIHLKSEMSDKLESQKWSPGEKGALKALKKYVDTKINEYSEGRDFPAMNATSHLSPHLHFGEISPWQVIAAIDSSSAHEKPKEMFIRQLFWREFARYFLWHFPGMAKKNYRTKFDKFKWRRNKKYSDAWQHGRTGFPIVDAGMRELINTGYMHNRVRMIVASFLIKDLLIDWREGEKWFAEYLVDADAANNAMGWQWVAGSGPDAAPYFRIFNPELQSVKFDKDAEYIKLWLPELSKLDAKYAHNPSVASDLDLKMAGIELGVDYPKPIVDHKLARQEALDIFRSL